MINIALVYMIPINEHAQFRFGKFTHVRFYVATAWLYGLLTGLSNVELANTDEQC